MDVHPLVVCPSIHILFPDDNLSKHQWISPILVCALILRRSGLDLLMGKFHQFLTELTASNNSGGLWGEGGYCFMFLFSCMMASNFINVFTLNILFEQFI